MEEVVKAAATTLALGLALLGVAALEARRAGDARRPSSAEIDAAVGAVREFITISTHLAGSGGDPRFAERVPADPALVDRILAEVAFTHERRRAEVQQLVRLQIDAVQRVPGGSLEVLTREYWVVRSGPADGGGAKEDVRADVVRIRYVVAPEGSRWRVASWSVEDPLAREPARS